MPRPGRFTPAGFPTACLIFLESSEFSTQDKIAVVQLEAKAEVGQGLYFSSRR